MKRDCVFKCWAQDEWWYVYKMDFGMFGRRFRIYKGRKWYGHTDFEFMQCAIGAVVNMATMGMDGCHFKLEER